MRIGGYLTNRTITLKDDIHDTARDCMSDKGGPEWEGWEAWLDSKEGRNWILNLTENMLDVFTNHLEYGIEKAKE